MKGVQSRKGNHGQCAVIFEPWNLDTLIVLMRELKDPVQSLPLLPGVDPFLSGQDACSPLLKVVQGASINFEVPYSFCGNSLFSPPGGKRQKIFMPPFKSSLFLNTVNGRVGVSCIPSVGVLFLHHFHSGVN
mgnify:CR=1 FL=1